MHDEIDSEENEQPEIARKEYELKIDGVVDLPLDVDPEKFFDKLFDTVIDHIEKYNAYFGGGMSHKEWVEEEEME